MNKILVTGFKPFLNQQINPSEIIAKELQKKIPNVVSLVLPVEFENSFNILKAEIDKNKYDYIIMLGQASGRKNICLERFAMNWVETKNADEASIVPPVGRICEGPMLLQTKIDVDYILKVLDKNKYELVASTNAGNYVCNNLYFKFLMANPELKSIFIHLPLIEEQLTAEFSAGLKIERQIEILNSILNLLV